MVGARPVLFLFLAALLAGCSSEPSSSPSGDDPPSDPATGGTSVDGGPSNTTAPPRLLPWERVTLYFTQDGGLSFQAPPEGEVVLASPAAMFVTGIDAAEFALPPAPHAMYFMEDDVDVTLYLASAGPQVSNGGFDIGIWGGSSAGYGIDYAGPYNPATAPGEVQEFEATLPFGERRGFVVPAGESIQFLLAGPAGRETGQPRMLVGGDQASHVELTLANFTVDPLAGATALPGEDIEGALTGGLAVFCPPLPGTTAGTHEIPVDGAASWLRIAVEAAAADYDIDVQLLDGEAVVARGFTPRGQESIYLAAETLAGLQGKTLQLLVTPCGYGPSTYSGTIEQGIGGNATAPA